MPGYDNKFRTNYALKNKFCFLKKACHVHRAVVIHTTHVMLSDILIEFKMCYDQKLNNKHYLKFIRDKNHEKWF